MIALRRSIRCVALVVLLASLACNSPTGPGPCRNGVDGIGRGPTNSYNMACTYVGSDTIQCLSTLRQVGYCAEEGLRDITGLSDWFTSNPAVATFVSPGVLKVTGTGQVQVGSKYRIDLISDDYVYVVSPGTTPERLLKLLVIVRDAANADRRLVGATIQVEPDRGPSQSCLSSATGHCNFWVFDGRARVRASLQGYDSSDVLATRPSGGFTMLATLDLQRIR